MGNKVRPRRDGSFDCGHEPIHPSKSGRCVWIRPDEGRYYCRSCGERGDAVTFVMRAWGVSYKTAARWLRERFGSPTIQNGKRAYVRQNQRARWKEKFQ